MTYNVFGGTLNLALSVYRCFYAPFHLIYLVQTTYDHIKSSTYVVHTINASFPPSAYLSPDKKKYGTYVYLYVCGLVKRLMQSLEGDRINSSVFVLTFDNEHC